MRSEFEERQPRFDQCLNDLGILTVSILYHEDHAAFLNLYRGSETDGFDSSLT